jgi:hypothetical protein
MKTPIVLLLTALALEIFVWNAGSLASLFYREVSLGTPVFGSNISYSAQDGTAFIDAGASTITFSGILADVKNLHLDIELADGQTLPYYISVTDEGNAYFYEFPERVIVGGLTATQYARVYTYGKMTGLEIRFDAPELIQAKHLAIRANVTVPLNLSFWRLAATFVFLVVAWLLRSGRAFDYPCRDGDRGQMAVTAAVVVALLLFLYRLATINPAYVDTPILHQRQYQELTKRLREGEVTLAEKPVPELLNAANPYDFIWRTAENIPYMADHVLYNGS